MELPHSQIDLTYVETYTKSANIDKSLRRGNTNDVLYCRLCDKTFGKDLEKHEEHFNKRWRKSIRAAATSEKDEMKEDSKCLESLKSTAGKLKVICYRGNMLSTCIKLLNTRNRSIKLTDFFLFNSANVVTLLDAPRVMAPGDKCKIVLKENGYEIDNENDYVVHYTLMTEATELFELHRLEQCCTGGSNNLETILLKDEHDFMESSIQKPTQYKISGRLNRDNYVQTLTEYMRLEEVAVALEIQALKCEMVFTKSTLNLLERRITYTYSLKIPNDFPPVKKMDRLWIQRNDRASLRIQANVTDILLDFIIHITVDGELTFNVPHTILLDDGQFLAERYALYIMDRFDLIDLMFPETSPEITDAAGAQIQRLNFFNDNIKKNPEQRQAILSIVKGVSYPAPYLIFGPPGTGKTATVTEAILQLLRTQPTSRILVTATSNTAADELTLRLLKYLRNGCYFDHNLYRLYAATVQREVTEPQLLEEKNSNYLLKSLPEWRILEKYRIIICTLTTAGRFMLKSPDHGENPSAHHFTHLFIDECGSSTETASLIPMAVCASMGRINAHIILSGDPKQLGPVVQCKTAEKLGYGTSMIERLMNSAAYQRNPVTKKYCSLMLTQLLHNFRSHPDIINISNDLFYNGVLVPKAPIEKTHRFLGWSKLPIKHVPIIFDATMGLAQQEGKSKSWYNGDEVAKVLQYINHLLITGVNGKCVREEEIGIISPYKLQCHKIEMELQKCGRKIMTASVEMFQGKEKPVIIISTVRTGRQGIGFLDSPQRLNVLLTRAQALMILIGDPNLLQKDRNWYDVLKRLSMLHVTIGERFMLTSTRPPSKTHQRNNVNRVTNENNVSRALAALKLI